MTRKIQYLYVRDLVEAMRQAIYADNKDSLEDLRQMLDQGQWRDGEIAIRLDTAIIAPAFIKGKWEGLWAGQVQ